MRPYILPLALLFIAFADLSSAQKSGGGGGAALDVTVEEGAPLTVECSVRVEQRAAWRVDGGGVAPDLRAEPERAAAGPAPARLAARLHAPRARLAHAGLYTCADDADPAASAVRVRVLPRAGPAPAPAATIAATTEAGAGGAGAGAGVELAPTLLYFNLSHRIEFNCSYWPADADAVQWSVNGTRLEQLEAAARARYELLDAGARLVVRAAREDDWGNYSCARADAPLRAWQAHARPLARLPADANVVEGQTLTLTCRLIGKPYRPVVWSYEHADLALGGAGEAGAGEAGAERLAARDSAAGVPGGVLELRGARREDAGVYRCRAEGLNATSDFEAAVTVRVKDQYAALWPFLGICLEVFVLCAVILVYEKRRTKPELDDSDADTHDQ